MKRNLFLIISLISIQIFHAQQSKFKCEKVHDAVKLIDETKFDEAIVILKECEKIDPKDYTYPYEIAYAQQGKKDYKAAISQLEKIKSYPNIQDDYYQLLGNTYDYDNNPEKAIATYEEGLKKFPNSGRLYLERGVMYEFDKNYDQAITTYEKGIKAQPTYPSNYYRAANLYLTSNNRFAGLLYGEIFVNLERTTKRTQEMSKLLYDSYKTSIIFESNGNTKVEFCEAIIDAPKYEKTKRLPLCMVFGKRFILAIQNENQFSLENLATIRNQFVKEYFTKDYKDYPNVLFGYLKKLEDNKVLNAYNHYIFQIGDEEAFAEWKEKNQAEYEKFADWYTTSGNGLKIDKTNLYIAE